MKTIRKVELAELSAVSGGLERRGGDVGGLKILLIILILLFFKGKGHQMSGAGGGYNTN